MDIEEVAAKTPEKIIKVFIDPLLGIKGYHCQRARLRPEPGRRSGKAFSPMVQSLFRLFVDYDCSLLEINPLVITTAAEVIALDAKITFDDNALYRHKDILEYRDLDEEDPLEVEASKFNLNYIKCPAAISAIW